MQVSRALATMVRNPDETLEVRLDAYSSLELINNKATVMDRLRRNTRLASESGELLIKEIDWNFFDSFISE